MKKGFIHIAEVIIVILLVFVILFQFASIPHMRTDWTGPKLGLMANDVLYSLDRSGIDWFSDDDVKSGLVAILPNTTGFIVKTQQLVRPVITVGCVCDEADYNAMKDGILTDYYLNGPRRSFVVSQIDPGDIRFPLTNDVVVFVGYGDLSSSEARALDRYLASGRGVVEFSDLTETQAGQAWHQNAFGIAWTPSTYLPSASADFYPFLPADRGTRIEDYFYNAPHELYPDASTKAYWRMNSGIGTTAWDSSNDNNGDLYNGSASCYDQDCPKWVYGRFGQALQFDGVNDYINVSDAKDWPAFRSFTIEAWVYPREFQQGHTGIVTKGFIVDNDGEYGIKFRADPAGTAECDNSPTEGEDIRAHVGTTAGYYVVCWGDLGDYMNGWHHFVGRWNGTGLSIFWDGQEKASVATAGAFVNNTRQPVRLAYPAHPSMSQSEYFNGSIDEVMIYDEALSADKIREHYTRKFPEARKFTNFASENVYLLSGPQSKIIVEQGNYYSDGPQAGYSVPLAVINWGINGNGRSAWMSGAPESEENHQLMRALVVWAAGERDYEVVGGELKSSSKATLYKVLGSDMFEPVRVDLTLGYYY